MTTIVFIWTSSIIGPMYFQELILLLLDILYMIMITQVIKQRECCTISNMKVMQIWQARARLNVFIAFTSGQLLPDYTGLDLRAYQINYL